MAAQVVCYGQGPPWQNTQLELIFILITCLLRLSHAQIPPSPSPYTPTNVTLDGSQTGGVMTSSQVNNALATMHPGDWLILDRVSLITGGSLQVPAGVSIQGMRQASGSAAGNWTVDELHRIARAAPWIMSQQDVNSTVQQYKALGGAPSTVIDCMGSIANAIWYMPSASGPTVTYLTNVVVSGCFSPITSSADSGTFILQDSLFYNNTRTVQLTGQTTVSTCVFMNSSSVNVAAGTVDVSIVDSVFLANQQSTLYSAMGTTALVGGNIRYINGTLFLGNGCYNASGAASVDQGGGLILQGATIGLQAFNSSWEKNCASSSGGGVAIGSGIISAAFTNCTWTANVVGAAASFGKIPYGGGVFITHALGADVEFNNCTWDSNVANWDGGGLAVQDSTAVSMTNCHFIHNRALLDAGGAVALKTATVTIGSSTFQSNYAGKTGGAVFSIESSMKVEKTAFVGNTAGILGGVVHTLRESSLEMDGCTCSSNSALSAGAIALTDSQQCTLTISNSLFLNNSAAVHQVSSLSCTDSGAGGAICMDVQDQTAVTLTANQFHGNIATNGGALHISVHCNVSNIYGLCNTPGISNTSGDGSSQGMTFSDNAAIGGHGALAWINQGQWYRHFFVCDLLDPLCSAWFNVTVELQPVDLLPENQALKQQAVIASYSSLLASQAADLSFQSSSFLGDPAIYKPCANWSQSDMLNTGWSEWPGFLCYNGIEIDDNSLVLYVSSNSLTNTLPVAVDIVDAFGSTVDAGSWESQGLITASILYQYPSQGNSSDNYTASLAGDTIMSAAHGRATFKNLRLRARPGQYMLSFSTASFQQVTTHVLKVFVRHCVAGEIVNAAMDECNACMGNTYSLTNSSTSCDVCPPEVICDYPGKSREAIPVGAVYVPIEGYWHSHPRAVQVHRCVHPPACSSDPGRDSRTEMIIYQKSMVYGNRSISAALLRDKYSNLQCAEGYFGNLCAGCIKGWGRHPKGVCAPCPKPYLNNLYFVLSNLVAVVLVVYTIYTQVSKPKKKGKGTRYRETEGSARAHAISLKILLNYLQVASIVQNVPLQWPSSMDKFLNFSTQVSSGVTALVAIDCSLPRNGIPLSIQAAYLKMAMPLIIMVCSAFVWPVIWRFSKASLPESEAKFWPYMTKRLIVTALALIFFYYSSLTTQFLTIFSCPTLDSAPPVGESWRWNQGGVTIGQWWTEDYNVLCYDGAHLKMALCFGVPGLVLISLGVPIYAAIFLYRNKHKLYKDDEKIPDPVKDEFAATFGFFYRDYKPETFYWESVVMARKLVLAVVVVFLRNVGIDIQVAVTLGAVVLAVILHMMFNPFRVPRLGYLERLSLWGSTFMIYLSVYFVVPDTDTLARILLSFVLVSVSASILVYLGLQVGWESLSGKMATMDAGKDEKEPGSEDGMKAEHGVEGGDGEAAGKGEEGGQGEEEHAYLTLEGIEDYLHARKLEPGLEAWIDLFTGRVTFLILKVLRILVWPRFMRWLINKLISYPCELLDSEKRPTTGPAVSAKSQDVEVALTAGQREKTQGEDEGKKKKEKGEGKKHAAEEPSGDITTEIASDSMQGEAPGKVVHFNNWAKIEQDEQREEVEPPGTASRKGSSSSISQAGPSEPAATGPGSLSSLSMLPPLRGQSRSKADFGNQVVPYDQG